MCTSSKKRKKCVRSLRQYTHWLCDDSGIGSSFHFKCCTSGLPLRIEWQRQTAFVWTLQHFPFETHIIIFESTSLWWHTVTVKEIASIRHTHVTQWPATMTKKSVHLNSIKEISCCLILSNCLHELRISKRDNDWKCKYANNNKTQRELANMKTDKKSPTSSIFLLKANYMWWRFVVTILSKSRFVFLWTSRFRKNQKNKAKRCAWTKSL